MRLQNQHAAQWYLSFGALAMEPELITIIIPDRMRIRRMAK